MWQVLLLAAANKDFCDKVTNFEPVWVCGTYTYHNNFNSAHCSEIFEGIANVAIEKSKWQQVSYTENKNTFSGCRAECPDQTEKGCFNVMKKFTDNYNVPVVMMMGFTSFVDGKRELAFFEQDGQCEPVLYTKEMLKAACEQGFRSHHGIQPPLKAVEKARARRSEREKFNNLFEKGGDNEKSQTGAIIGWTVGGIVFVCVLVFFVMRWCNPC